jgi:ABC-type glycerol-3-phosphate transport system substrate-binding protein
MPHLKRFTMATTTLAMVVAAGCGSSDTSGSGGTCTKAKPCTINWWPEGSSAEFKSVVEPIIANFNKAHPGVTVKIRYATSEFRSIIREGFSSGKPPEIFEQEGYTDVFDYVVKKQLVDVTDWMKKNGDRFAPATLASVTYKDGKMWGIPTYVALTNSIWYNKKILAANGIDPAQLKTWDDMLAAFAKLKSAGITPIAYGAKDGWPGSEWYFSFFGKLAGGNHMMQLAAGNCGYKWTDPDSVKAAQMYVDLNDKGYFTKGAAGRDWNASNAEFLSGKAGFYAMGTWFIQNILTAPNKNDFGLITFPNVPGGKGGQETQLIAPGGYALSYAAKDPAKKAAALAFIDELTSVKNQKALNKVTGVISAVTAANTPDALDPLSQQVVREQLERATQPYTFLEHVTTIATGEDAIWKGSIGVLTGQKTAESWMKSVQQADDSTKGQNSYDAPEKCSS